jgi:hypothetical protein
MKTNNPETLSTLGTQDTGRKQTSQRHCKHWFSSCILCAHCSQCLWIVCFHPVSCVRSVHSVFGLFVFVLYLVCPVLTMSLDCLFSSCILCAQCSQCLWIVCFHPVSCVPSVDSVSGLFVFFLSLVCPVFTVSLGWLFASCDNVNTGHTRYRMETNKQSRDTVNTGHTRYRKKTNNPETLSTLGTQDTG